MWKNVADKDRKCEECVKRKEVKSCMACGEEKVEAAFSRRMWKDVADKNRKCEECVKGAGKQRGFWKCVQCHNCLEAARFSAWLSRRATQKPNGTQRCNKCDAEQERGRKRVAERTYDVVTKTKKVV